MTLDVAITPLELSQHLAAFPPPTLIDVRRQQAFDSDPRVIPGAIRRLPETVHDWAVALEPWRRVVVYCVRGHEVGRNVAEALRAHGFQARYLTGGLEQWHAEGFPTKAHAAPTRWVTRERPKIDRIACPWLIRRFIDPTAEFFYVPKSDVRSFAVAHDATAYDIPDVPYGHAGAECSFDAFIRRHELDHPALAQLATIVRGADTAALDLAAQAAGLLAVSRGLSRMFANDHQMLKWGMLVYDALYEWCRETQANAAGDVPTDAHFAVPHER
jgi:rhodanese-related sulfurtransferase